MLWRVGKLSIQRAEALQRHWARDLGTDLAATSAAQLTRLPDFLNHKYRPPQLVEIDYGQAINGFPDLTVVVEAPKSIIPSEPQQRGRISMIDRARRYLAATPPAIEGQHGDLRTFRVCCRLVDRFGLSDHDALDLLKVWNTRCQPSWSEPKLLLKIISARRQAIAPSRRETVCVDEPFSDHPADVPRQHRPRREN